MDMSKIQRALGFIEGVCAGLKEKEAELIEEAIVEIDCELENAAGDSTTGIPFGHHIALQGIDPRNDNARKEIAAEMHTTAEMDELVERLFRHREDYGKGRSQPWGVVCADCKKAAEVITRLRLLIEDLEYAACAERP